MMKGLRLKSSSVTYDRNEGKPFKNFFANRKSKEAVASKRMFGNRRGKHGKDLKVGKKFTGDMKSSSISPSVDEFDSMMSKISESPARDKKKKSMFMKKE